jgi:LPS sulfotransferase NodH
MTTAAEAKPKTDKKETPGYKDRPWIPRFWDGMIASAWFRVLWRNRFAVHPIRWGMCVIVSCCAVFNSLLTILQNIFLGRKIEATRIAHDPIFIVGHWRSGTTMLHELLVFDQRHTFPNTYECFAPSHSLFTAKWLAPALSILMPARRPMDNMPAGWDRPQEDEFALCNLGAPSPYLKQVFPNRPSLDEDYLDFVGVPSKGVEQWKRSFLRFLKCVTLRQPRRIVLKSPPHTARIKTLLEMFPKARFVHIVRDPYVVFSSTVNLWKRLYRDEGLQMPHYRGLEEYVFQTLVRMYDAFERDRTLIDPSRFCEVHYEELAEDPLGQMQKVYEQLHLGEFEKIRPALEKFAAGQKDFKTNKYQLAAEKRAEIADRWGFFFDRYGYER